MDISWMSFSNPGISRPELDMKWISIGYHVLSGKVWNYYKENKWRHILQLNENSKNVSATKLLWVWPSERNVNYLKNIVETNECVGIISIGCGCGLLEWIIQESTGLNIIGYEVNEEWWTSKYSNPQFIELCYPEKMEEDRPNSKYALLFCYFNNGKAFREYIRKYHGKLVIIIGPQEGTGRHTDPQPFDADFGSSEWIMQDYQQVKSTRDFIAVYVRSQ